MYRKRGKIAPNYHYGEAYTSALKGYIHVPAPFTQTENIPAYSLDRKAPGSFRTVAPAANQTAAFPNSVGCMCTPMEAEQPD